MAYMPDTSFSSFNFKSASLDFSLDSRKRPHLLLHSPCPWEGWDSCSIFESRYLSFCAPCEIQGRPLGSGPQSRASSISCLDG